ncbi:MAG: hypothetical protein AAFV19_04345 [Pseudomonadota bacterium]
MSWIAPIRLLNREVIAVVEEAIGFPFTWCCVPDHFSTPDRASSTR